MKQKFELVIAALLTANGNRIWMLPTPITVRLSEQDFHIVEVHGICISPKREIHVMDGRGNWEGLKEGQTNADKMITAIHDRVMRVFKKFADENEEMDIRREMDDMRYSIHETVGGGI
jgi:hypothetical protein